MSELVVVLNIQPPRCGNCLPEPEPEPEPQPQPDPLPEPPIVDQPEPVKDWWSFDDLSLDDPRVLAGDGILGAIVLIRLIRI